MFCINRVYFQILECILCQLDPGERLQKTLVCRRWAEIVLHGALFEDVWFVFPGSEMERAVETIIRSQRHHSNLRIFRGTLTMSGEFRLAPSPAADLTSFNSEFWTKVGQHLLRLVLDWCILTGDVFHKILRSCPKLRSLELKGK